MSYVMPYKIGSRSATALARGLNVRRSRGTLIFRPHTKIINWGKSEGIIRGRHLQVVNKPEAVRIASDKISSLRTMKAAGVSTVTFTTNRNDIYSWIDDGSVVYGRALTRAHSGRGINIITEDTRTIPNCPLYTRGINKAHEYRVHVMFGEVVDFSKKKRRDGGDANALIKNLANGWVFCRQGVALPNDVRVQAINAVRSLGLDFGAVDVLYREREDKAWILEVNTAPGLEGTTLERYTARLNQWLRSGR